MRQQRNEGLRRKFAEKANGVGPWIERNIDQVAAIGMGMQGTLEDQLQKLRQYEEAVSTYKVHMDELEKVHQEVQENMIFENRYTQYTMEVRDEILNQFNLRIPPPPTDTARRLGATADVHSAKHQRGGEPDSDA